MAEREVQQRGRQVVCKTEEETRLEAGKSSAKQRRRQDSRQASHLQNRGRDKTVERHEGQYILIISSRSDNTPVQRRVADEER